MTVSHTHPAGPQEHAARPLWVIKLGGRILAEVPLLDRFLARLAASGDRFVLVHGGGEQMKQLAARLGIPQRMVDGRRVTDEPTLELALMTFAGTLNTRFVARMQAHGICALGMTGADADVVRAVRRRPIETSQGVVDFGWVGDVAPEQVNAERLSSLLALGMRPVLCALTHDGHGQMLNTNADTLAATVAAALAHSPAAHAAGSESGESASGESFSGESASYLPAARNPVRLVLLSDVPGVLRDPSDPGSLIPRIDAAASESLIADGTITAGMIPKIRMALQAVARGVAGVLIGQPDRITDILASNPGGGTYVE